MPGLNVNVKRKGSLGALWVLLAVSTAVFGINISRYRGFLVPHESVGMALVYTLAIIGVLTAGVVCVGGWALDSVSLRPSDHLSHIRPGRFFLAVLLVNLLMLVAYYPGTGNWDTLFQIRDFFDGTSRARYAEGGNAIITAFLNDHHPVVTTLIFSSFVQIGKWLHDERLGLFLYSLLQVALFSYAYTQALRFCQKRSVRSGRLAAAFYLFHPFLPYYAIMMLKDSLYSALFLIYFLHFLEAYRGDGSADARGTLALVLLSIAIPLTKKTGVYIIVPSNAILLLRLARQKRGRLLGIVAAALVPLVVHVMVFPMIVYPVFNIFPGGKQEVIATLLQQSARVGIDHPDAYSEADVEVLNRVFRYSAAAELYDDHITDPIKNTYKLQSVKGEDLWAYYKLWFRTGLKHPITYLKATAGTCGGYFSPTTRLDVYRKNHYQELTQAPLPLALRGGINALYDFLMDAPGLNLLLYMVVYTWWIPLFGTAMLLKKRGWRALGSLMPVYVSILTLVVSPCAFRRYALPFVMIAPILLCETTRGGREVGG